jgi:hypothetical protein
MSQNSMMAESHGSVMAESSVEKLTIPFPAEIMRVFKELERIEREAKALSARNMPSLETIEWAMEVLLRVVPSSYLLGSEINAFQAEIHVSWENGQSGKSVVAFLQKRPELKIYHEQVVNGEVVEHTVVTTEDVGDLSARLRWFFRPAAD